MRKQLGCGPVNDADGPLEQRLGKLGADALLLARTRLEEERRNVRLARAALVGIVSRRAHALDLHGAVPVGSRGDRAAVGAEADQRGLIAEAVARELPDIVLAPYLAHFGELGIAALG